jgi:hypothetical protein
MPLQKTKVFFLIQLSRLFQWQSIIFSLTSDLYLQPSVLDESMLLIRIIQNILTRLTRRVPLVEQELLTLPWHLSSPTIFSGVRVTRSLVLCVCFVDRCLSFCTFSFGHCIVCSSSIYRF